MTAIEARANHLLPPAASPHSEVGWWGMAVFLMSEGALFATLIASYFYLAAANPSWPPSGIEKPTLRLPLIMTLLLVSSSVVLVFAERGFERGDHGRYRAGALVTVLLGIGFLSLQAREYADKLQHVSPATHAYTSMFFAITGLHGTHVAFGLLVLLWTLARDLAGKTHPRYPLAVKNASFYWHFVDGVWLVIFTVLYLSPRWS